MQGQAVGQRGFGRRGIAAVLAAALMAMLSIALFAQPAHAASRVDVSPAPSVDGPTTVTLSGSGFQYQPNAPGGVYIFFGAVSDPTTNSWAPSQGGRSGETFGYANTSGALLLAAFQGGSSAEAANAVIDPNGNWTAQMTIPGSSFASSSGNPHEGEARSGATIDCLQVQCGIITIGAHGYLNANNESFTPVSFVTADGSLQSGSGAQSFTDEATAIDIPVQGTDGAAATEDPAAAKPDGAAATPQPTDADAPAAESGGGAATTWIVLGVLALAVLALIAAVVAALVKRRRSVAANTAVVPESAAPEATATESNTTTEEEKV